MDDFNAIVDRLSRLVSMDTSEKNELPAARLLKSEFEERGIPASVFAPQERRGSVYARLEGKSPETLLILTHLDTAGFMEGSGNRLIERGGRYFGRGTLDCKGPVAVWTQVILDLYRELGRPDKSLAFIASADEERGGGLGTGWLLEHTDCFDGVFLVIGEGGGYPVPWGDGWLFTLQTGEITEEDAHGEDYTEEEKIRVVKKAVDKGYYNQKTLDYFLRGDGFLGGRHIAKESFYKGVMACIEKTPECGALGRYGPVFEEALREAGSAYGLLPVISPGYSDNRFPRGRGIDTLGFFPLDPGNPIGGIHGRYECISAESIRFAYQLLRELTRKIVYFNY